MADAIKTIADHVRKAREPGVLAILAYGSCLRDNTSEGLIDLYVLTDSPWTVSRNRLASGLCYLLLPNVYYFETKLGPALLRAKVAIMPLAQFAKRAHYRTKNPYIWARFSQPCEIIYARNVDARAEVKSALEQARASLWRNVVEVSHKGETALEALTRLLRMSYATELRPEDENRARKIITTDKAYYQEQAELYLGRNWISDNKRPKAWALRKFWGRVLSIGRLIKAAFTFQGGADYMAWKIARHSGVQLEIKPWQRRHPVLGTLALLPQILRQKAIR